MKNISRKALLLLILLTMLVFYKRGLVIKKFKLNELLTKRKETKIESLIDQFNRKLKVEDYDKLKEGLEPLKIKLEDLEEVIKNPENFRALADKYQELNSKIELGVEELELKAKIEDVLLLMRDKGLLKDKEKKDLEEFLEYGNNKDKD